MCFYYLRVPESGFRTVTSRPELIPSVTLPREEGEGNRLEKVARHPPSRPLLGAKCGSLGLLWEQTMAKPLRSTKSYCGTGISKICPESTNEQIPYSDRRALNLKHLNMNQAIT